MMIQMLKRWHIWPKDISTWPRRWRLKATWDEESESEEGDEETNLAMMATTTSDAESEADVVDDDEVFS